MEKKTLSLIVKKEWFDKIASGEKNEEYREIKPYWTKRLVDSCKNGSSPFTHVLFINGYGSTRPKVEKEIESISIGLPKKGLCPEEWLDAEVYIIKFK